MTSPDGITWTLQISPADNQWYSVVYGKGKFVAVALNGTGNRVMTSACQEIPVPYTVSACGAYTWINGQTYTANNNSALYPLSNVNGCDSGLAVLNLTVLPLPTPVISQTGNILQSPAFNSYQWLLNQEAINGATAQTLTATQNGNYSLIATDANGCSDTSNVITLTTVGLEALNNAGAAVYPIPARGYCTFRMPEASGEYTLTITDVAGRAVAAPTTMVTETQTLDLSGWAAGVYLAHIANGQYAQTLRFQLVR